MRQFANDKGWFEKLPPMPKLVSRGIVVPSRSTATSAPRSSLSAPLASNQVASRPYLRPLTGATYS